MTTVVTISAHCGDAKEVHVTITGSHPEDFHIANGEKAERYAYDDRVISVQEVAKIDRRAKEIEDAEFSLRQATLRFEDAASRGFPLGNEVLLKADAIAKHDALDALLPEVAPEYATLVAAVPAQQESDTDRDTMSLSPEAVAFLNSLDPAPFAEPTGDADPSLAPSEPYPEPFADLTAPSTSEH